MEEDCEVGELSLTEYIVRKMAEQRGPYKKRVSLWAMCSWFICCILFILMKGKSHEYTWPRTIAFST